MNKIMKKREKGKQRKRRKESFWGVFCKLIKKEKRWHVVSDTHFPTIPDSHKRVQEKKTVLMGFTSERIEKKGLSGEGGRVK